MLHELPRTPQIRLDGVFGQPSPLEVLTHSIPQLSYVDSPEDQRRPSFERSGLQDLASLSVSNPKWGISGLDDLPEFEGPTTPIAGWTVGLVGGFTIGLDFDELAESTQPSAETIPADLD